MGVTRVTIATLFALVAVTMSAAAGVPSAGPATVDATFKKLDDRAGTSRASGTLPQWSNPDDRALLEQMWNVPAVLGSAPYTARDLPALLAISVKENVLLKSYVLFSPDLSGQPDPTKNTLQFQDEIARGDAFTARLSAAMLTALGDLVGRMKPGQLTDDKTDNFKEIRIDLIDRAQAAALAVGNTSFKPENREILVDALADSAEPLAIAATPQDREGFELVAKSVMRSLPAAEKERMKAFAQAMKRQDCQAICKLY